MKKIIFKCDVCKNDYGGGDDKGQLQNLFEQQEFVSIRHQCGYGSVFEDGDTIEIDICQNCFKKLLGEFVRTTDQFIPDSLREFDRMNKST